MEYLPEVQQEFFLTNLLKASDYSVVVKAYNSAGSGPPSHELYVRTLDGDLPPSALPVRAGHVAHLCQPALEHEEDR
ncbi:down syndrome cell adhesion molecule-like protein 1 [Caerostris extrusa]|uniref:Down syndrome cell adhesion molecule-like protein 1 n=1 Tax=Caerostris extrusa TaxID=172846 RepID=A0AAV4QJB0_CAEEX|nr:down syndrome cell adhesion molecule-like protein 1 [Caerostris extrusa]